MPDYSRSSSGASLPSDLKQSPKSSATSLDTLLTEATLEDQAPPPPSLHERPVKAIIIGAGIGGIATAVLLSRKVNSLTYTVYDKNSRVGGTWAENTYPGVRCDVPSHVYQLTFAPNTDWSEYYSKGSEIQQYYERVVEEYDVKPNLRLSHEVQSARWIAEDHQWEVKVKDLSSGSYLIDRADFLISAPGRVNEPSYPQFEGLDTFRGKVIHTSRWNPEIDLRGKRVAVIGNGASGQQILPNILPEVAHIDHYVRSKTYVSPTFRQGYLEASVDLPGGRLYSDEERKTWREDPAAYFLYRKELEKTHYGAVNNRNATLGSEGSQKLRDSLLKSMLHRLKGDKEWLARLTPDYAPGCKRLTPAPGYLEAITGPKVEFIDDKILRATSTGLETEDGKVRNVDIIITATGFRDGFYPRFPTIAANGDDLSKSWRPGGRIGFPENYLGIMAPEAPNYFFILQAQGNAFGGSVPYQCEIGATYIARAIRKVQRQGYRSLVPTARAAEEFSVVVDRYFEDSVTNDKCRSYFKLGGQPGKGKNVIGFPGTTRQRLEILFQPRWEDFIFASSEAGTKIPDARETTETSLHENNRFLRFWGDGRSVLDRTNNLDAVTSYLKEIGKVDLKALHEDVY